MKTLYDIIQSNNVEPVNSNIDGHIHLFDHTGYISKELIEPDNKCVCFADIAFRYLDQYEHGEIIKYYDSFIQNHLNPTKHILLATGITANEIINIHKKYPQYIKGFGELKCYERWKEGNLPFGNLNWIKPVLEYNKSFNLPVYIHYNLDSPHKRAEFENLLVNYSSMPIVLCHSGLVNDNKTNEHIFQYVKELLLKYDNLWIDISEEKAYDFYFNNIEKLYQLNTNKVICGSDINPIVSDVLHDPVEYSNKCYSNFNKLCKLVPNNKNINILFGIDNSKCNRLIKLYQSKLNTFDRHKKIHLLSRGYLIGMYGISTIKSNYTINIDAINEIINWYENNNVDKIINKYVLIGYELDNDKTRKREIGKLFLSCDLKYKKFLSLVSLLELVYTFKRVNLLSMINTDRINRIISSNSSILNECILEDKYDFKHKASTKYINSLFFIYNLKTSIRTLSNIIPNKIYDDIIELFIDMYENDPSTTTLYGLTHILIGASDFYTKQPDDKYLSIVSIISKYLMNNNYDPKKISFDLYVEMLLCNKLFGDVNIAVNLDSSISLTRLAKDEHTNMLYILLNKHSIVK